IGRERAGSRLEMSHEKFAHGRVMIQGEFGLGGFDAVEADEPIPYRQMQSERITGANELAHEEAEPVFGDEVEEAEEHESLRKVRGRGPTRAREGEDLCGCADLNREGVAPTSTSSWRVYQFHHNRESRNRPPEPL